MCPLRHSDSNPIAIPLLCLGRHQAPKPVRGHHGVCPWPPADHADGRAVCAGHAVLSNDSNTKAVSLKGT